MVNSKVNNFRTDNQDNRGFLKSINLAGFAGLFAGILMGCFLVLTLIIFSYPFLIETGHAVIIVAYMIAYPAVLLFFLFIIAELLVYLVGKLVLGKNKRLFQKVAILVPAGSLGVVFFVTAIMYLLFYIYDGLFNWKVVALTFAVFLISVFISVKLWSTVKKCLEYLTCHRWLPISAFCVFVTAIIIFWMSIPSVPYPGCDLDAMSSLNEINFKNSRRTGKSARPDSLPNIILITIDATRADHLGAYGYKRDVSPNIDKLAAEDIRFDKCYVHAPATVVNLTALLTSGYPGETGVYAQNHKLPDSVTTLTEQLKEQGYTTIGLVAHDLLPWENGVGLAQGFDYFQNFGSNQVTSGPDMTRKAISKLEESDGPYFLWLHYFEPHTEYNQPKEFFEKVSSMPRAKLANKEILLVDYGCTAGINLGRTFGEAYRPPKGSKKVKESYIYDLYDSEILYVDSEIGKLFAYLENKNQFEDSLIIISADHGESLVEHGLYCQHCIDLYRPNTEIPLIMHLPGNEGGNIVADSPVSTMDIAPTILEVAGIAGRDGIRGTSLLQFLPGAGEQSSRGIILMTGFWEGVSLRLREINDRNPDFAIVSNEYKYIVHSMDSCMVVYPQHAIGFWRSSLINGLKADEMYNLVEDPLEENNIRKDEPRIAESLKRKLYESAEFISYINLRNEKLRTKTEDELTDEEIKKLKSLGYL